MLRKLKQQKWNDNIPSSCDRIKHLSGAFDYGSSQIVSINSIKTILSWYYGSRKWSISLFRLWASSCMQKRRYKICCNHLTCAECLFIYLSRIAKHILYALLHSWFLVTPSLTTFFLNLFFSLTCFLTLYHPSLCICVKINWLSIECSCLVDINPEKTLCVTLTSGVIYLAFMWTTVDFLILVLLLSSLWPTGATWFFTEAIHKLSEL